MGERMGLRVDAQEQSLIRCSEASMAAESIRDKGTRLADGCPSEG